MLVFGQLAAALLAACHNLATILHAGLVHVNIVVDTIVIDADVFRLLLLLFSRCCHCGVMGQRLAAASSKLLGAGVGERLAAASSKLHLFPFLVIASRGAAYLFGCLRARRSICMVWERLAATSFICLLGTLFLSVAAICCFCP